MPSPALGGGNKRCITHESSPKINHILIGYAHTPVTTIKLFNVIMIMDLHFK